MKKTYINPTMQVFTIQTAGMLAQSKFDSEKGNQELRLVVTMTASSILHAVAPVGTTSTKTKKKKNGNIKH